MKRVLMIAYHFPPLRGSSGIQRTLRFVQHLPNFGWEPIVLTAQVRAYESINSEGMSEVAPEVVVERAFALDTARHLSLFGRYPSWLALPDRWSSWYLGGVIAGLSMVRRYRPDVIWSTYPVATAHKIGATVARLSGLPWVADFRDPMVQDGYPADAAQRRAFQRVETTAMERADHIVFTTPGAAQMYRERYPDVAADRICVIENGYDEETFAHAEAMERTAHGAGETARAGPAGERFILLHSGIVYPSERDPRALFAALAGLKAKGIVTRENFCLRLRASAYDAWLAQLTRECAIDDLVELAPPLPYREALVEMLESDGLLVMQASNCNQQIPAKLYEYLRTRKAILALTDPAGDTAGVLRASGLTSIAVLDSQEEIERELPAFIERVRSGAEAHPGEEAVVQSSRERRTASLANLMHRATSPVLAADAV